MNEILKKLAEDIVSSLKEEVHNGKNYLVCYAKLTEKEDRPDSRGRFNYFDLYTQKVYCFGISGKEFFIYDFCNTINDFYFYHLKNKYPTIDDDRRYYMKEELNQYTLYLAKKLINL